MRYRIRPVANDTKYSEFPVLRVVEKKLSFLGLFSVWRRVGAEDYVDREDALLVANTLERYEKVGE